LGWRCRTPPVLGHVYAPSNAGADPPRLCRQAHQVHRRGIGRRAEHRRGCYGCAGRHPKCGIELLQLGLVSHHLGLEGEASSQEGTDEGARMRRKVGGESARGGACAVGMVASRHPICCCWKPSCCIWAICICITSQTCRITTSQHGRGTATLHGGVPAASAACVAFASCTPEGPASHLPAAHATGMITAHAPHTLPPNLARTRVTSRAPLSSSAPISNAAWAPCSAPTDPGMVKVTESCPQTAVRRGRRALGNRPPCQGAEGAEHSTRSTAALVFPPARRCRYRHSPRCDYGHR
jgi:hypothetical protein